MFLSYRYGKVLIRALNLSGGFNIPLYYAAIYDADTEKAIETKGGGVYTAAPKDF
jgi:hypothetical protein